MNSPAIAIFDSGLGGLTVFHEVAQHLPHEALIYLGDTARVPYGTKSKEIVTQYAFEISSFLMKKNIKALVVACNTASAYALESLKESLDIPVLGVIEPGVKRALEVTQNHQIGVIGTEGTIRSEAYCQALKAQNASCQVLSQACPLFVPFVEEGWLTDPETEGVVKRYLLPLIEAQVDTLILGCTHYPLLKKVIHKVMGPKVTLVDSAEEIAKTLLQIFSDKEKKSNTSPAYRFYVTDAPERFQRIGQHFLGGEALENVEKISL